MITKRIFLKCYKICVLIYLLFSKIIAFCTCLYHFATIKKITVLKNRLTTRVLWAELIWKLRTLRTHVHCFISVLTEVIDWHKTHSIIMYLSRWSQPVLRNIFILMGYTSRVCWVHLSFIVLRLPCVTFL